jgi:hypothetical protein
LFHDEQQKYFLFFDLLILKYKIMKIILILIAVLALTGSGCGNRVEDQAVLARSTLDRLALAANCHDLESVMSPKLYEALGPCDERLRFDASERSVIKTEVESCVPEEHFTKDGKEFAVEDAGGYSAVFRCAAPQEEGEGTNYILLRQVGSVYQIVNMTSHPTR